MGCTAGIIKNGSLRRDPGELRSTLAYFGFIREGLTHNVAWCRKYRPCDAVRYLRLLGHDVPSAYSLFSLGHRIPGKACVMNFSCAIIFATNEAKGASSDDNGDNHVC